MEQRRTGHTAGGEGKRVGEREGESRRRESSPSHPV